MADKEDANSELVVQNVNHCVSGPVKNSPTPELGDGGVLPSNRLLGMCRWMGSHFQDWID